MVLRGSSSFNLLPTLLLFRQLRHIYMEKKLICFIKLSRQYYQFLVIFIRKKKPQIEIMI